jgi:hypothetical protein
MDEPDQAMWGNVARGEAEPTWDLFLKRIARSYGLTEAGRETARWAMAQIAGFLGESWLRRSFRQSSSMMSWLWTSLNDAPHTHLRRTELAARLGLLKDCWMARPS